ncbi:hypothetical protein AAEX28_14025 [Lentisphaerota bacterium WC36G]|nr:hypothetical protein LJT99_00775 [Lentisphaerae bacterium WC36]
MMKETIVSSILFLCATILYATKYIIAAMYLFNRMTSTYSPDDFKFTADKLGHNLSTIALIITTIAILILFSNPLKKCFEKIKKEYR